MPGPRLPGSWPDVLVGLTARTVALDLLLRYVYAEGAKGAPDPAACIRDLIEGIIGSMEATVDRPTDPASVDRLIWDAIEAELRQFMDNVVLRLSASPGG